MSFKDVSGSGERQFGAEHGRMKTLVQPAAPARAAEQERKGKE